MNKKREKKSKEDVTDYELKVPLVRDEQTQKKLNQRWSKWQIFWQSQTNTLESRQKTQETVSTPEFGI